jgi:hypothetical protein
MEIILRIKLSCGFSQGKVGPKPTGWINLIFFRNLDTQVEPHIGVLVKLEKGVDPSLVPISPWHTPDDLPSPDQKIE